MQKIGIHRELEKRIAEWQGGKAVRAPRLGHTHREVSWGPNEEKRIDDSQFLVNRQELALEWCFFLIHEFLIARGLGPLLFGQNAAYTYSDFALFCDELEETRMPKGEDKLTPEELAGAESLAWKALLRGWDTAIQGHADHVYVEASRPEPVR